MTSSWNSECSALETRAAESCSPSPRLLDNWSCLARISSGAELCIRPLRPDDREREIAFIESLSERSRYFRLFTPLRFLPPHLLEQLMDIDYDRRMAFVATIQRDGKEQIIGVARYGEAHVAGTAELGITVTDAWQRQGVARLLIEQLMRFAASRGIQKLIGTVLAENLPMIALSRALGFLVRFDSESHLFQISRDLNAHPQTANSGQTLARCGNLPVSGPKPEA